MCEKACVSGGQLDPRQTCGECLTDAEYNAIFPSWVTSQEKQDEATKGY